MLKDVLRRARKAKGYTLDQTAQLVGLSRGTVFKLERGDVKSIKNSTAEKFSRALDIPLEELIGSYEGSPYEGGMPHLIPVFEHIGCGVAAFSPEYEVDHIPFDGDKDPSEYFAMVAKGSSMEPKIYSGDMAIFRKQPEVENSEIAAVQIGDDEYLLKKVKMGMSGLTLVSLNPAYDPIFYSWEDVSSLPVRIIGKLVQSRRNY